LAPYWGHSSRIEGDVAETSQAIRFARIFTNGGSFRRDSDILFFSGLGAVLSSLVKDSSKRPQEAP
jgi:hypothetical protein